MQAVCNAPLTDLSGLRRPDADTRPWLRHAAWPDSFHPLIDECTAIADGTAHVDHYAFVPVEGDGVHEIPVGPVHAGIIEPGHFRFSVVGEKVLRLEERLGYVHKGIERRFTELPLLEWSPIGGARLRRFGRRIFVGLLPGTRGDGSDAFAARANWLRALALELERLANHLGDLGAIGNDAGFAFGLAQFSRLKEQLLRATERALGQRYLMDFIVPGGTRVDLSSTGALLAGRIHRIDHG